MCDFTYTLCCDCGDNFYKLAVYVANVFRLCTEHDIMYLGMWTTYSYAQLLARCDFTGLL